MVITSLTKCTVLAVHDADTFTCNIFLPFPEGLTLINQKVRVQGIDAWEVAHSRPNISEDEIAKGKIARDAVIELLKTATVYLEPQRKGDIEDPHRRIDAHVWIYKDDTLIELADWLKAHGHARTT